MSKVGPDSDPDKVTSPARRARGDKETRRGSGGSSPKMERLVLSPQLRVARGDVFRLESKYAVDAPYRLENRDGREGRNSAKPLQDVAAKADESAPRTPSDTPDTSPSPRTQEATPKPAATPSGNALKAKIAALETAIAKTADQWEPDGVSPDDYAGTQSQRMSWQDSVELDATGKPIGNGAGQGVFTPLADEQLIDEDMLRELVSETVRSELRGALGERMTRNIRKLVRREINRALAARDFT